MPKPKVKKVSLSAYVFEEDAIWFRKLIKQSTVKVKSADVFKLILDNARKHGVISE